MRRIGRRAFLQTTALAGAGLKIAEAQLWASLSKTGYFVQRKQTAVDPAMLGKTGIRLSRLAMGSGTHGWAYQSDQTRLGPTQFTDLVLYGYDQGVTFWDAADQYGSHRFFGAALKHLPRDRVVILTKTRAVTAEEMRKDLDRFRRELKTDYIDILLLHCMVDPNWPETMRGPMDVLSEAKEKGIIRSHGVSCHTLGALKAAAASPWVDVDLARINPGGHYMDDKPEVVIPILRQMKAAGKGVLGMKIFGQGKLSHSPDLALRHAAQLDCLDAFTIGFVERKQLDQVLERVPAVATLTD